MVEGKVSFQNTSIFDEAGSQKAGKSDPQESAGTNTLAHDAAQRRFTAMGYAT